MAPLIHLEPVTNLATLCPPAFLHVLGSYPHHVYSTFVLLVILLLHLECVLSSFLCVFLFNAYFNTHFVP